MAFGVMPLQADCHAQKETARMKSQTDEHTRPSWLNGSKFLLKKRVWSRTYDIYDEQQKPILYVEDVRYLLLNWFVLIAALFITVLALFLAAIVPYLLLLLIYKDARPIRRNWVPLILVLVGGVVAIFTALLLPLVGTSSAGGVFLQLLQAVGTVVAALGFIMTPFFFFGLTANLLFRRPYIAFYEFSARSRPIIEVRQMDRVGRSFVVYDEQGQVLTQLAREREVGEYGTCYTTDGQPLYSIREEGGIKTTSFNWFLFGIDALVSSFVAKLLRIVTGKKFVILAGENPIARFGRDLTLDLIAEPKRETDRRILLAISAVLAGV